MRRLPFMNEEQAARMKAKARKEAKKDLSKLKVIFADTKEGVVFKAAHEVAKEDYGYGGEDWVAMVMYAYGVEQGKRKKRSHAKKLKLSAI